MTFEMNRRGFLGGVLAAGAAPVIFGGCARRFSANNKINVGVIGLGRIATSFEIPGVLKRRDIARIVAVCDLDTIRVDNAKSMIEKAYNDGTKIAGYRDYKELIARKDIDAVMICVPDFWHALIASSAILSDKAVWLQKPFTQTILESRLLANLAKKRSTVFQIASQQRSWNQFEGVCRAVNAGVIGDVARVEVGIGIDRSGGSSEAQKVPANFDYETWLGPTPVVPYNETRCHSQDIRKIGDRPGWIQLAPYGWGMITNWGAHHLDIAQWGLGKQLTGPEKVEGTCNWMDLSGGRLWNVHTNYDLHFYYNGGRTDLHVCDRYQTGVKFIGVNGEWLFCTRGAAKVTPSDPEPRVRPGMLGPIAASKPSLLPKLAKMDDDSMNVHVSDWLDAVAADDPSATCTSAEIAHRSSSVCCLGQMCMELGRGRKSFSLDWDPCRETTGSAEYDRLMKPFARDKFDLKVNLAEFGLDLDREMRG
jgi:predicted dehydrogenase